MSPIVGFMNAREKIELWCRDHGSDQKVRFVKDLEDFGFTDNQIFVVLITLDGICLHCFDADPSCPCWNDN